MKGGFEFALWACGGVGLVVKQAVGEGAAELFVKEDECQGDAGPFVGQPVGVAFAVALQQSMRFQFAEIVAKLIETVAVGGEAEGGEESGVDVFGSPAPPTVVPPCSKTSIRRIIRVSWILMPGNFAVPMVMGRARRWRSGKST